MKPVYQTVLFDADNTLFDFGASERQALRWSMEARGMDYSEARFAAYCAINDPLWQRFNRNEVTQEWLTVERFRRFGETLGYRGDPAEWNADYLDKLGDCGALLPGALELVAALKPYCRIALATNGLRRVQRRRLRDNPLAPYLDGVFISQELGVKKPQREFFQHCLEALSADPAATVMVGDDLTSDIQGAVNAGLDSIWYCPRPAAGSANGVSPTPTPTYTVDKLSRIPGIVLGGPQ